MSEGKFLALWTKYLPVIRILLKKSVNGEQQVSLGKMELRSVDNRKNANYSFTLEISKGRVENRIGIAIIAKDLFTVLSGDSVVHDFMRDKTISMRMGSASLMSIKSDPVEVPQAENISIAENIE
jgi:hypothetical protein